MGQYRNIMVIVDPAMTHTTAFVRGVELAKKTGAGLTLLIATCDASLSRAGFFNAELGRKAIDGYLSVRQRWLDLEAAQLKEDGINAEGIAAWHKRPHEEIAAQALRLAPDLVIKDVAETANAVSRAVFTSADWQLMRLCPAPLLLVNPHSSSYPQRILAAIDPLDSKDKPATLNDEILEAALTMARQCEAPVHVVHAYQFLPSIAPMGAETAFADAKLFEKIREDHRDAFLEFGRTHGVPDERMHLLEGEPAEVIATLAEDINADLVVLGAIARSGLKRVLLGSTAEQILGAVKCDLLVLKPAGFVETVRGELEEVAGDM